MKQMKSIKETENIHYCEKTVCITEICLALILQHTVTGTEYWSLFF